MKKLYLISIPVLLILNYVGLENGNMRLIGIHVLSAVLAIAGLHKHKLGPVLVLNTLMVASDFFIRMAMDLALGYNTIADNGDAIPIGILMLSQMMVFGGSSIIVLVLASMKYAIVKLKDSQSK